MIPMAYREQTGGNKALPKFPCCLDWKSQLCTRRQGWGCAVDRPSLPQSNPGRGSRRKKKKRKKENREELVQKRKHTTHTKGPTDRLIRPEK
ncbi:hypothetical protein L873DRAFT_1464237 [Choiromyces venosus 120613-1]|uniref:Uncharacterized protein n=1 Tax=Choiromyces venosus 120613-1 TaxID=1336337 RepID=A0A3N4K100_9PEZI|nr:hypothetical protein L873DRAFT_1464237 [Choiromyces venosus 120613-1]